MQPRKRHNLLFSLISLRVIPSLALIALVPGCYQGPIFETLDTYLLQTQGKIYLTQKTQQNEKKLLVRPGNLPADATLISDSQATATLQFRDYMTVVLQEKSVLDYTITPGKNSDPWHFQIRINLRKGSLALRKKQPNRNEISYFLVNEHFFPRDNVTFHIHSLTEKEALGKAEVQFQTVSIVEGGLHFISPVTGRIDMFIHAGNQFTVKNGIPLDIAPINPEEMQTLSKTAAPDLLKMRHIYAVIYGETKYWEAISRRQIWIVMGLLISLSLGLFGWLFWYLSRNRRHRFHGRLYFYNYTRSSPDERSFSMLKLRTRNRLYIGRRGYCHIRVPGWTKKYRVMIKGYLAGKKEIFRIFYRDQDLIFLRRKRPGLLSFGDRFIIDTFIFELRREVQGRRGRPLR